MFRKTKIAVAVIATLCVAVTSSASAANRRVLVVNDTNHTLTRLYASGIRDSHYHGDWLGRYVLNPGQSMVINFNDGTGACLFDVRGEFNDNTYVQRHSVNVCRDYRLTFNGD